MISDASHAETLDRLRGPLAALQWKTADELVIVLAALERAINLLELQHEEDLITDREMLRKYPYLFGEEEPTPKELRKIRRDLRRMVKKGRL